MFKLLEKLRNKPEKEKIKFLFFSVFVVIIFFFFVWFYFSDFNFREDNNGENLSPKFFQERMFRPWNNLEKSFKTSKQQVELILNKKGQNQILDSGQKDDNIQNFLKY